MRARGRREECISNFLPLFLWLVSSLLLLLDHTLHTSISIYIPFLNHIYRVRSESFLRLHSLALALSFSLVRRILHSLFCTHWMCSIFVIKLFSIFVFISISHFSVFLVFFIFYLQHSIMAASLQFSESQPPLTVTF